MAFLLVSCVSQAALVTNNFTETSEAFPNPMKGFRPSRYPGEAAFRYGEYTSTFKHYIPYTGLENNVSDGVDKIKNWCNSSWANVENHNVKVIPRVVIYYPGSGDYLGGLYWPPGVPNTDPVKRWFSSELKNRLASFIQKLGESWDNDPRVAGVEMGLWGYWGEHHLLTNYFSATNSEGSVYTTDRIPPDFQKVLGDAFSKAFTNKVVIVRYENMFTNYSFGYHWDSFAQPADIEWANWMNLAEIWKDRMLTGEVAYDWGDLSNIGTYRGWGDSTLSSSNNTQYIINMIRSTHISSLGVISEYNSANPIIAKNAALMQKEFGYRFVITQAIFNDYVPSNSQNLTAEIHVKNVGNAPFYYPWLLCFYFLSSDKKVVCKFHADCDVRGCLPGNSYAVNVSIPISASLSPGVYTLAVSINDPAGDLPSLRFANQNYYHGGITPLGKFGYGQYNNSQNLEPFDSLKSDASLFYVAHPTIPLLGAFSIPSKVFGSAFFPITPPNSLSGGSWSYTSANQDVATVSGNTVTITGAGTSVITATQAANGKYSSASKTAILTVKAATPPLRGFTIPVKIYGNASFSPEAPASPSSGAFSYISSNLKVAMVSGNAVTIKGAGSAVITAKQAASANYSTNSISATLTVAKADQTITFSTPATNTFTVNRLIPLNGSSTSNLPISYTSSKPKILSISSSGAVMKARGTTTVTASQAGNANYKSATPVAVTITLQ